MVGPIVLCRAFILCFIVLRDYDYILNCLDIILIKPPIAFSMLCYKYMFYPYLLFYQQGPEVFNLIVKLKKKGV